MLQDSARYALYPIRGIGIEPLIDTPCLDSPVSLKGFYLPLQHPLPPLNYLAAYPPSVQAQVPYYSDAAHK